MIKMTAIFSKCYFIKRHQNNGKNIICSLERTLYVLYIVEKCKSCTAGIDPA